MSQVFIISAPSGSGKSTLVKNLLAREPELIFSISYTTRAPRGVEQNGKDYHFISREEFLRRRDNDEFLEWAQVFENYYGTHCSVLEQGEREGRDVVLDIDVQGARQLRGKIPQATSIFILAPSREELEKRLKSRGEDAGDVIERRLAGAAREIQDYDQYDYILVNDDVAASSELLHDIVKATRASRKNNPKVASRVKEILSTFVKQS